MVLSLLLCGVAATHIVRNTLYVDILSYMPKKLSKMSGLAILNGDVWTHNETFDDNRLPDYHRASAKVNNFSGIGGDFAPHLISVLNISSTRKR